MIRNERGIALIITLLVVALLAITVVEFSYSVEIDQRMARNALNGLQATLLARSGINMGEAFLLHDSDAQVDAFTEDWCPSPGPDGHSCRIDETNSQLVIPENMRLRVQILDESGKVNINMTRPPTVAQWKTWVTWKNQGENQQTLSQMERWKNVIVALGLPDAQGSAIMDYWNQLYQSQVGSTGNASGTPGAGMTPSPMTTPAPGAVAGATPNQGQTAAVYDLPSLDDAGVIPGGFTTADIRRLRPVLTALDSRKAMRVNVNTAPRAVLAAILPDPSIADNIISRRQDSPIKAQDLSALITGLKTGPTFFPGMLGVQSSYFLIRASAVVNPDPITGRGGVSRSASMLVRRDLKPGVPPNAPPGTQRWTLTQLDWQKEGGAALFQPQNDGELGSDDTTSSMNQDFAR